MLTDPSGPRSSDPRAASRNAPVLGSSDVSVGHLRPPRSDSGTQRRDPASAGRTAPSLSDRSSSAWRHPPRLTRRRHQPWGASACAVTSPKIDPHMGQESPKDADSIAVVGPRSFRQLGRDRNRRHRNQPTLFAHRWPGSRAIRSRVETILPDSSSDQMFGANAPDRRNPPGWVRLKAPSCGGGRPCPDASAWSSTAGLGGLVDTKG